MYKVTLYEQAAAIAIKLESIDRELSITPEQVLRKGNANLIRFMYDKLCKNA